MGVTVLWTLYGIFGLAILVGGGWCLHRFCIRLEDAGYLYYRKRGSGGGSAGFLYELDRLTRPSIEHVVKVEDETNVTDDQNQGEQINSANHPLPRRPF